MGNLGNEVIDNHLYVVYSKYKSFQKCKVVRDKVKGYSKGFGFVSFSMPEDFLLAIKETNGKYIGKRRVLVKKSNWEDKSQK